jgi:hypothetical protein
MSKNSYLIFFVLFVSFGCNSTNKSVHLYSLDGNEVAVEKNNYVVMFLVPDCPLALNYTKEFQELADSFSSQNLIFKAVVAGNQYAKVEIVNYLSNSGLRMPIWIDKNFEWCKKLGVKVSPSFYLVSAQNEVYYSGALDNKVKELGTTKPIASQHFLKEAIVSWQSNKYIAIPSTEPKGCFIEYQ